MRYYLFFLAFLCLFSIQLSAQKLHHPDDPGPYQLAQDSVLIEGVGWAHGYWNNFRFYSGQDRFSFFEDGVLTEDWLVVEQTTTFTPAQQAPVYREVYPVQAERGEVLYRITMEPISAPISHAEFMGLKFKSPDKAAKWLKYVSIPLSFFSGVCGGVSEGHLSTQSNWATRSQSSHFWRDAGLWTGAGAVGTLTLGITLGNDKFWPSFGLAVTDVGFYYIGTRIGYEGVTKHGW